MEQAVHAGPAVRGLTVMMEEVSSQNRRSLQNINTWQLARPRMGPGDSCSV